QLLCVSPAHFSEHLDVLVKRLRVARLSEGLNSLTASQHVAAITFDDGYEDNLENAKPILARYGAAASVFVVATQIGLNREFWLEELDAQLLQSGALPRDVHLTIRGNWHHWQLNGEAAYPADRFLEHRQWNVMRPPPTTRHLVYSELCQHLRSVDSAEREGI